ncbi:MAG: 30S ribosomal protein S8 [Candidatus Omnitrophica bacterium]|nr:30S ribosomal protein S8 [Candidatus Omnitrophota bacterium]HOX54730.1 30S ribosomal protein S8 [Candidatus Omnitrophota bacterium]
MSLTDPIANMLTSIRNANRGKKETVDVPASKMALAIVDLLKKQGYIENFRKMEDKKQGSLRVYLKFDEEANPVISGLKRISRPGLRVYADRENIPRVLNGLGLAILSTSKGILTDSQARQHNVGGEVICYVW